MFMNAHSRKNLVVGLGAMPAARWMKCGGLVRCAALCLMGLAALLGCATGALASANSADRIVGLDAPMRWGMSVDELKAAYAAHRAWVPSSPLERGGEYGDSQLLAMTTKSGSYHGWPCNKGMMFYVDSRTGGLVSFVCSFDTQRVMTFLTIARALEEKYERIPVRPAPNEAAHKAVKHERTRIDMVINRFLQTTGFLLVSQHDGP